MDIISDIIKLKGSEQKINHIMHVNLQNELFFVKYENPHCGYLDLFHERMRSLAHQLWILRCLMRASCFENPSSNSHPCVESTRTVGPTRDMKAHLHRTAALVDPAENSAEQVYRPVGSNVCMFTYTQQNVHRHSHGCNKTSQNMDSWIFRCTHQLNAIPAGMHAVRCAGSLLQYTEQR